MKEEIIHNIIRNHLKSGYSLEELQAIPILKENYSPEEIKKIVNNIFHSFGRVTKFKRTRARIRKNKAPDKIFTVRIPLSLFERLEEYCTYEELKKSKVIYWALKQYLDENNKFEEFKK